MPISSKRKNHKQKVEQYRQKVASDRKKAQEALLKLYQEQQQYKQQEMKQQINGVDVENVDIDLDGLDLNIETELPFIEENDNDMGIQDFSIPVEEIFVEEILVEQPTFQSREEYYETTDVEVIEEIPIIVESKKPKKSTPKKDVPKKDTPKKK